MVSAATTPASGSFNIQEKLASIETDDSIAAARKFFNEKELLKIRVSTA